MKGIITEGVRGAFIRLIRLIVYILLILTITFIVGLISNKKANALVYKGQVQTQVSGNNCFAGNQCTGSVNSGKQDLTINYEYTPHLTQQYDLVSLQFTRFAINFMDSTSQNITDYCNGSLNTQGTTNNLSLTCTTGSPGHDIEYLPDSRYYSLYAFATYESGSISHCWQSAEVNDSFMCPMYKNDPLTKITLRLNSNSPTPFTYSIDVNTYKLFYNYDSTDIINSNGTIINQNTTIITQQQQQNDYVQNGSTTGAQNDSTNALSGLQQTFSQKMTGMNELTQMVFAPIQMMLTISSGTCIPMEWDIPFVNVHVVVPCMSTIYNNYFGLFITMFSTVIMGIYAYRSVLKLVNCIKDILDAENDKLEVLEL